ncbi:ferritin-like domain-containing protein [Leptolyngbya sp. FACHB-261]|uniref:ferritin-like domain-containing protein n=1 Tax=Leptolyngbya sp. FACHB-261 TaxID=2692806 RepID=UPI001685DE05|nr:ferritin-like domain-containing protein [Leptolyngbya sp. FACHB-261]MBD2101212.1 ferritin-like domain-containing protein [Leptolyngbya sp. FACHB-261]
MNLFTHVLHILGSGAVAFVSARSLRDPLTRPNTLAGLQLAESGSVPFLEALSARAAAEGDTWLAEKLAKHASDENRHGQIFAHALKQLNKQVIDFKSLAQAQEGKPKEAKPDDRRRSPFFEAYFEGYSQETFKPQNIDWTVFMASTYILELDASRDFVRMAHALPDDPVSVNIRKGMLSVAQDETGHAAYLREALERRLSPAAVTAVIDEWRTRKVNAMLAMVSNLLQKGGKMPELARDGVPIEMTAEPDAASTPVAA